MHMWTPRPCADTHTHTHTPLCGYGLSTGPTDGLSSWWLRNRSPPTANNNNNNNTYPYRSMLETLLSYGEDAKKSQLSVELFYNVDAGNMEETIVAAADNRTPNSGLQKRHALITQSREFDMMGRIHGDIIFQEKYVLNHVNIKIKLIRSNDNFCLMGAADAKIVVTHAALFVRKVKLSSSVFLSHAVSKLLPPNIP